MSSVTYATSPAAMAGSFTGNLPLIGQLVKRDVQERYRGSALGVLWTMLNPLLMLAVYTFVFAFVFRARFGQAPGGGDSEVSFALMMFAGMIIHQMFGDVLNRSPSLIAGNANFVKKVVFPLEIYPYMLLGSAITHLLISLGILVLALGVFYQQLHWTVIFLPVVLLPFLLLSLGIGWILASLGVYLRDIGQTMGLLTTVLLFLSPVFYPVSALPETMQPFMYLNPLTLIIEETRRVVIAGQWPHFEWLGMYLAVAAAVAWFGFWWFQKTRRGFADVL